MPASAVISLLVSRLSVALAIGLLGEHDPVSSLEGGRECRVFGHHLLDGQLMCYSGLLFDESIMVFCREFSV